MPEQQNERPQHFRYLHRVALRDVPVGIPSLFRVVRCFGWNSHHDRHRSGEPCRRGVPAGSRLSLTGTEWSLLRPLRRMSVLGE